MRRHDVLTTCEPDNLFERQVRMRGESGGMRSGTFLKEFFRLNLFNFPKVVRELMLKG